MYVKTYFFNSSIFINIRNCQSVVTDIVILRSASPRVLFLRLVVEVEIRTGTPSDTGRQLLHVDVLANFIREYFQHVRR